MKQRGNILFLILLAVVLFAALTYAVTSGMRGGGKDAGGESAQAKAATILQFLQQLDTAAMRMTLTGGQKIENLSFEHAQKSWNMPVSPAAEGNSNCSVDSCKVFKPDGGNVADQTFTTAAVTNPTGLTDGYDTTPGHFGFSMFRWPYAKTDANDIVIRIFMLHPLVCREFVAMGMPINPPVSGSFVGITPVSGWDSPARTVTGDTTAFLDRSTFISGSTDPANANGCTLWHLVYAR